MALILEKDVADYLKVANSPTFGPHILTAQAQVAAEMRVTSLLENTGTEKIRPANDTDTLVVREGPIASVASVTVDGVSMDLSDLRIGRWVIERTDGDEFLGGSTVAIVKTYGFTSATLPDNLKRALIVTAAAIFNQPNLDLVYEKIGDYTRQTASGVPGRQGNASGSLSPPAVALIREFVRPRV
jgi:hypothetical protein